MKIRRIAIVLTIGIILSTAPAVDAEDFSQPIEFSHKNHAGKNEIPCEFCHTYARRSNSSGAPSMESCIGCHRVVKGTDESQVEQIAKLIEFWNNKEIIAWKKIHDVPDFVHFSHKSHIRVGIDCTDCHGDIDQLDLLSINTMINDLSMGWCLECHKTAQPTINGKIISPVRNFRGGSIIQEVKSQAAEGTLTGSTDCYACHK